jgi:hypothetical protein
MKLLFNKQPSELENSLTIVTVKRALQYRTDKNRIFKLHRKEVLCMMKRVTVMQDYRNRNANVSTETEDTNM